MASQHSRHRKPLTRPAASLSSLESNDRALTVTVAVIVYNGRPHLQECLASLVGQTHQADEILAIDNASTDGSADWIRAHFPEVRIVELETNRGYAGGCNVAAGATRSDIIAFLNQDVRLDPRWLRELIEPLHAHDDLAATQSLIMLYDEPDLVNTSQTTVNFLGVGWLTDYRQPGNGFVRREVAFLSGAAFAIRRATFLQAGGFDDAYGSYHEDVDFSWRLHLMGWRAELAADSRVYHKYRFSGSHSKNFFLERNRLMTLFKNYRGRTLAVIFPALLATELGICLLALGQGWLPEKLAGYRDLFRRSARIRASRRHVQRQRNVADREIAALLVGAIHFQETRQPLVRMGSVLLAGYWWAVRRLITW